MREILISLGVMLFCGLFVILVQLTSGQPSAVADELATTPPAVVQTATTDNSIADTNRLIAMNTNSEENVVTTDSGLK